VRIDNNNNNNVSIAQRLHGKLGPYLHPAVLFHNKKKKEKTRCVNPTKPKRNNLSGGRGNKKDLFSKAQLNLHKLLIISALKEEKEGHFPYCEREENQHR